MNSDFSRRAFLGAAGAALSATAVRAGDEDEPVRIGVIGTGGRGSDLLRALATIDGVEVVAVCDDYAPHLAQGVKYAGPKVKSFTDYRHLLDVAGLQAVVVATPLHLHFRVAADALAAGRDVFVEKIMCRTLDEGRKLVELAANSKRVVQVGLQRRANPVYKQAAAMVDAGMIGRVVAVEARWHRNNAWRRPIPLARTDPNWSELDRRLNWRLYRGTSAGLMAELGSHQLDVINWMLGGPPRRVLASAGLDQHRDGREVADNVFCVYDYELTPPRSQAGDAKPYTVRVAYSTLCSNAHEGASETVLGTRGTLYLTSGKGLLYQEAGGDKVEWSRRANADGAEANAALVAAGKTLKLSNDPWAHRGKPVEIDIEAGDDTRDELVAFVDCVRRGDATTIADARAGLVNAASVFIANESAESGRAVEFPKDLLG